MIMPKEHWDNAEVYYVHKLLSRGGEAVAIPVDVIRTVLEVAFGGGLFPDAIVDGGDPDEEAAALSITTESYLHGQAIIADDRMETVRTKIQSFEEAVQYGEHPPLPSVGDSESELLQEVASKTSQPIAVVWRVYGAHLEWLSVLAMAEKLEGKS